MENNTTTIQFEVPDNDQRAELQLKRGTYTASVKKTEDKGRVEYQVSNFKHSGDDSKAEGENQLIFIRDSESDRWVEAFHNSRNDLTQQIGQEIERVFNEGRNQ